MHKDDIKLGSYCLSALEFKRLQNTAHRERRTGGNMSCMSFQVVQYATHIGRGCDGKCLNKQNGSVLNTYNVVGNCRLFKWIDEVRN